MKSKLALFFALGLSSTVFANTIDGRVPCPSGESAQSLSYYLDVYGPGVGGPGTGNTCYIGELAYSDFYFQQIAGPTLPTRISASDFIVTPNVSTNSFSLIPINNTILNGTFGFERYFFAWYIDPPPIIAGDELQLDPPDANVAAYKWGCPDTTFSNSSSAAAASLPTTPGVLGASTFSCVAAIEGFFTPYYLVATPDDLIDTTLIEPAVPRLDVRMVLDLGPGEISGFNGILQPLTITGGDSIPEPGTNAMMAAGIAALLMFTRKKLKR